MFSASSLFDLLQITLINLVMSGENTIVIAGMVAGLPKKRARKIIAMGVAGATLLRIVLSVFAAKLLQITGLAVAGGLLLLWVGWTMGRELLPSRKAHVAHGQSRHEGKSDNSIFLKIMLADISLSLDNVLAVVGVARDNMLMLAFGLILSAIMMGVASQLIARLIEKAPWLNYLAVAAVIFVALSMIRDGAHNLQFLLG